MVAARTCLAGAALAFVAVGPALAQAKEKPTPAPTPKAFAVELEQAGGPVSIKDHEAVFFRGVLETQGVVKETGRQWLKLYLDTAPEPLKAAVGGHFQTLLDDKRPAAEREAALKALAAMGRDAIVAMDAVAHETAVKAREAGAVADLRTILSAEMAYASGNGGFYDGPPCLIEPQKCRPKFTGTPFLQLASLETRNGYNKLFLPGPAASKDEIKRAKASPSSLKDFVVLAWPETFGETGYRAFCADSSGRICFVEGPSPPAKGGRCEGCQPLP